MSTQGIKLKEIADAIREKEGTTAFIPAETFAERILALPVGVQAPEITLPAAGTQAERLARIAAAIRAKEGSEGPIPAEQFAERILALTEQPSGRLPAGYTEVEYIQSGNGQYIQTEVAATTADLQKVIMDVEPADANGSFFGTYMSASSTQYWYFSAFKENETVAFRLFNVKKVIDFSTSNRRVTIILDRKERVGRVNNLTTDAFPTATGAYLNVSLLARSSRGAAATAVTYGNKLSAKLYSCQMYKDESTLVRDFVPCTDPSGTAGLYDLVGGSFYKSPTSIDFTAGPAV